MSTDAKRRANKKYNSKQIQFKVDLSPEQNELALKAVEKLKAETGKEKGHKKAILLAGINAILNDNHQNNISFDDALKDIQSTHKKSISRLADI